jgi:uncharacterized membrane protein
MKTDKKTVWAIVGTILTIALLVAIKLFHWY